MNSVTVSATALHDTIQRALRVVQTRSHALALSTSIEDSDVARVTRWMLSAEDLGLPPFGIQMLVRELSRLDEVGQEQANRVESKANASYVVDASRIPGQLALAAGVRSLLGQARHSGISGISLQSVGALGVLGFAARDLAEAGLLALICANAPAMVAPWGGTGSAVGTNPLAIAAPRVGTPPLVLDFATSPMTMAALKAAALADGTVEAPGGFTEHGEATQVARDIRVIAPESRIASLAGMTVEMLTRAVSGPANEALPGARTGFLVTVNPAFFGTDSFAEEIADLSTRWAGAGGHVPQRFDTLSATPNAARELLVDAHAWASLEQYGNR